MINTGLVIAFIGIPGVTDDRTSAEVRVVEVPSPPVTYIVVVDADGNVLVERTALDAGASAADAATMMLSGQTLRFAAPVFAPIARPTFVAAQDGVAYVTSQGKFELWRVGLDGTTRRLDLDGIDDLGSIVMDVDVTTNGTMYVLVSDGVFDWRIYRGVEGDWTQIASSILSGWSGQLIALSVADNEGIYLTATEPAGVYRMVPPFREVSEWVPGTSALGVDVSADEGLLVYAAPQTDPVNPLAQVGYVRDGRFGSWQSLYAGCGTDASAMASATATATAATTAEATATAEADAEATVEPVQKRPLVGPKFPRDVAIIDSGRILVVDSLNHIVRLQEWDGGSEDVFGVACEQGGDARHLLNPRGAAIDGAGNVFITDTANNRVVVLAAR
ncbi:MAG: hypothetical protein IID31_14370 [Planctomycetes bacterium]|nr:hypothetical protein [Planctomycetota bacterium]